jgi:hypothetical protein
VKKWKIIEQHLNGDTQVHVLEADKVNVVHDKLVGMRLDRPSEDARRNAYAEDSYKVIWGFYYWVSFFEDK